MRMEMLADEHKEKIWSCSPGAECPMIAVHGVGKLRRFRTGKVIAKIPIWVEGEPRRQSEFSYLDSELCQRLS